MQVLFENWRKFVTEAKVSYQGILKLSPSPELTSELSSVELPEGASPLPPDKLHVTLVHQSILRDFRVQVKGMEIPEAPEPKLVRTPDGSPELQEAQDGPKRSWVVFLDNQEEIQDYVNKVLQGIGVTGNPEPERRFHISVANLTGKTSDSVRYP
jgi:hypothetical protein